MKLSDLTEDAIFAVAFQCAAPDVFSLSQTCSRIRNILTSPRKPLWLKLLRELDDFTEPCRNDDLLAPSWSDLSSEALRESVMKAYRARSNWAQRNGPRPTRTRTIDLKNRGGFFGAVYGMRRNENNPDSRTGVKFTRGSDGRYATVLWTSGYLQVWDIEKGRCIWTYPQLGDFVIDKVLACDSEVLSPRHNGSRCMSLVIVALPESDSSMLLKEFTIDLSTMHVKEGRRKNLHTTWNECLDMGSSKYAYWFKETVDENRSGYQSVRLVDRTLMTSHSNYRRSICPNGRVTFVDDHVVILCKEESRLEMHVFDARNTFFDLCNEHYERFHGPRTTRSLATVAACSSQRKRFMSSIRLPLPSGFSLHSGTLCPIHSVEREKGESRVFVVATSLKGANDREQFMAFEVSIVADRSDPLTTSAQPFFDPLLTILSQTGPLVQQSAQPYLSEFVMTLGRGGRGLLASTNEKSGKLRCYAFSVEQMFAAEERHRLSGSGGNATLEPLGPVLFGKDGIAPGAVALDPRTGAVVFTRDDPRTENTKELVIQYYD